MKEVNWKKWVVIVSAVGLLSFIYSKVYNFEEKSFVTKASIFYYSKTGNGFNGLFVNEFMKREGVQSYKIAANQLNNRFDVFVKMDTYQHGQEVLNRFKHYLENNAYLNSYGAIYEKALQYASGKALKQLNDQYMRVMASRDVVVYKDQVEEVLINQSDFSQWSRFFRNGLLLVVFISIFQTKYRKS